MGLLIAESAAPVINLDQGVQTISEAFETPMFMHPSTQEQCRSACNLLFLNSETLLQEAEEEIGDSARSAEAVSHERQFLVLGCVAQPPQVAVRTLLQGR